MSEEEKQIMSKMIYCNLINGEQAIKFNRHIVEMQEEIERLTKEKIELQETIRLANNNILKDISMIKTIGMERQEIIQRLFETSKILEGDDKR